MEKNKENCDQENRLKGDKHKRALLISKPELLEGLPGTVVFAKIKVKNDSH